MTPERAPAAAASDVEVVRRLYEYGDEALGLLRRGEDVSDHPALALWHPDCVLEEIAEAPEPGSFRGRDGVVRYWKLSLELWEEIHFEPVEIRDAPKGLLATVDARVRNASGLEVETRMYQLFKLRDGMVMFAAGFVEEEHALAAAGLR